MSLIKQNELVEGLLSIVGKWIARIVLYGSVARGTATVDSDVDIAILLFSSLDKELESQLSDFIVDMNLKYDKVYSVIDIGIEEFEEWSSTIPFYRNVNQEGIVLWKAAWLNFQNIDMKER